MNSWLNKARPAAASQALVVAALLGMLLGCASPAPTAAPSLNVPASFGGPDTGLWQSARTASPEVPDDWWRLFDDPVLADLQAQLAVDNQNLKAAEAQWRAAVAALAGSRAAQSPTVTLGTGATRSRNATTTSASGTTSTNAALATTYALSGSVSWEVDLWGKVSGAVQAAGARLQASRDDLLAARLALQGTLAQTYFALRASEAQGDAVGRAVQAYERSLVLTQNRYAAGVASAADVAQAQTQLKTAQAQQLTLSTQRAQYQNALAVLLGQPPSVFQVAPTARLPQAPQAPLLLPATLLQRRPDIAAAERRVAAANAQVGVTQAAFFPALTLSASGGYRSSVWSELLEAPHRFWSLGPALALTLWDGGARRAATDQALAAVDQAAAVYRQTVLTAFQEVEDNLAALSNLREETAVQADSLAAAQRAQDIALNQYRAGTVSYLNVVTAQTAALSAERSLIDARNRQLQAVAQLLKNAAGRWDGGTPASPGSL